jgi:hypothetical protein
MDLDDFNDRLPVKGDLVITKGRLTGYAVNAFNEDSISFESVLENGLPEVHPLGDEGLHEKLILHIPIKDVIAGIKKAHRNLSEYKDGSQTEVWITISIHSESIEWSTGGSIEYVPAVVKWKVGSQLVHPSYARGCTLRASTTSEEIVEIAEDLIAVIEENFERI